MIVAANPGNIIYNEIMTLVPTFTAKHRNSLDRISPALIALAAAALTALLTTWPEHHVRLIHKLGLPTELLICCLPLTVPWQWVM